MFSAKVPSNNNRVIPRRTAPSIGSPVNIPVSPLYMHISQKALRKLSFLRNINVMISARHILIMSRLMI
jgi:hypothetical protein